MSLLIFMLAVAVASCTSDDTAGLAGPNDSYADPELAQAIEAGLVDCFDPLHDSDGSGGFFEFCDRAIDARSAGHLDCVYASGDTIVETVCLDWILTRDEVPPQYFVTEPSTVQLTTPAATEVPAAVEVRSAADDLTGIPADMLVLEWNEFGGCSLIDLCRSYVVFGDGRVEGSQGGVAVVEGEVDPGLVRALFDAADVDTNALVASLGPGPCDAATDGISHEVWIGPADLRIDSCDVDLGGSEALIVAARQLGEAAERAAVVE